MGKTKKKIEKLLLKAKYSPIISKLKILQITNNGIQEGVLKLMQGNEQFLDTTTNGDLVYAGNVFQEIIDKHQNSMLPLKNINQLIELAILAEKYDYVMVIDNPK